MLHKDALKLLFPIELGGDFEDDLELEGAQLDAAQARAEDLLEEMFPDRSADLLAEWERVCGLTPGAEDTVQLRQEKVVAKLREMGGLSIAYFMMLAASLGYEIAIEELPPNVEEYGPESVFIWRIHVRNQPVYYFRAGQSSAGERLCWWDVVTALEGPFQDLKPAHTELIFAYT